ncbi:fatty-acid amide hydrolase 2-A-like [Ostrinia furnacalis]|uniref:fatty-acid amide hydrolase 2-A-like n=1 Tax=Ostrinia furnacalis TaxID=93504 RepID=UPI001038EEC9|nr:fatty-acid amide hydrolase 2-A-like [Ostrinia furnacalis]
MSTENKPVRCKVRVLQCFITTMASVVRFFCRLYYGNEGAKIPKITHDILKTPAFEVARKIRNKEITSVEVLETCIRRINDVNSALNCFVENRFELALKEAKEADALVESGTKTPKQLEEEKPLLGVPFTTKDCMAVKGLHHTSGVVLRKDVIADRTADVIRILQEKGAIIIGLTNVPELCMWWESHNHLYGRTNNPYNTTRIVGGSSGGEGTIQAAAGSIFGVGSDIGGSIRMPSFFNGIFGHKPSRHIVSNDGQFPEAETELHNSFLGIGPMTRYASDLKPLLNIMAGENSSKLKLNEAVDVSKLKVYYQFSSKEPLVDSVDPDIIAAMKKSVEFLKEKHNVNAEEKKIQLLKKSLPIWMNTMKRTKKYEENIMEKKGVFAIIVEIFKNIFGCSGNTLIGLATALSDHTGAEYGDAKYKYHVELKDKLEKEFKEMLGDDGVFLYPTHPTPALYHNEPLARPFNFSYTAIINCLGLPATNIPLGLGREGLPIGIQVVSNHNNDRFCFAVAEELEKAFGGWVEPIKS